MYTWTRAHFKKLYEQGAVKLNLKDNIPGQMLA